MNWSELFQEDAMGIQPAPKRVTGLLKSYRYANSNFGSAISVMTAKRFVEAIRCGATQEEASNEAYCALMDDAFLGANETKVMEFISELTPSLRDQVREAWLGFMRTSASNAERARDIELE